MSTAVLLCGLYIVPRDDAPSTASDARIPLKRVSADVSIVDCVASVTLSQVYVNDGARPVEAVYKFPVYESAAVYAFEAEVDGAVIKGVCKEREQAAREYNAAVAAGDRAFLLEEQKADIFQISVGNVPVGKPVTIRISYLHECKTDEDNDELRFTIPTTIASQTYGTFTPPAGTNLLPGGTTYSSAVDYTLGVTVDIRTATGPVTEVSSTTHPVKVSIDGSNPKHATARLALDKVYLDRDFVLVVKSPGLDRPRAVVEKDAKAGTKCCMVTFVPKFKVKEVPTEIIFVLDRSGSMGGTNIESARSALVLFLKSLPPTCKFNIIGFGSSYQLLFPKSVAYDESNLAAAVRHAETVQADLGGTEILQPLEEAVRAVVDDGWQRSVITLTDGEVYSPEAIFDLASRTARAQPTRFFTLGVGNAVSHHLVNGLARAGMGMAEFVGSGERMEGKVVKLVKAGVRGFVRDYKVTWVPAAVLAQAEHPAVPPSEAAPAPPASTSFFDEDLKDTDPVKREVPKAKEPLVRAAPFQAPALYTGSRFTSLAILDARISDPDSVTISGAGPDGPIKVEIPVDDNVYADGTGRPALHVMAARKLVQDLEEGTSWMHTGPGAADAARVEAETVLLSKRYGIVSKHTSYVAVQVVEGKEKAVGAPERVVVPSRPDFQPPPAYPMPAPTMAFAAAAPMMPMRMAAPARMAMAPPAPRLASAAAAVGGAIAGAAAGFGGMFRRAAQAPPPAMAAAPVMFSPPGAAMPPPPPPPMMQQQWAQPPAPPQSHGSAGYSFSLSAPPMPMAESAAPASFAAPAPPPAHAGPGSAGSRRARKMAAATDDAAECEAEEGSAVGGEHAVAAPSGMSAEETLRVLVSLQKFDGSFPADARLFALAKGVQAAAPAGRAADEWATAVAIAVMEGPLAALKDEWELVGDKAAAWLDRKVGEGERKRLVAEAKKQLVA